ncbi:scavenger receptor class B member 1-like [Dermatophagoides pteronyssinus]|uniref:scavenger receptor class B member 1-like n=1 Tax=Dermatophagoides pteronyssinus TaxID=6956 RepID=UPI003F672904
MKQSSHSDGRRQQQQQFTDTIMYPMNNYNYRDQQQQQQTFIGPKTVILLPEQLHQQQHLYNNVIYEQPNQSPIEIDPQQPRLLLIPNEHLSAGKPIIIKNIANQQRRRSSLLQQVWETSQRHLKLVSLGGNHQTEMEDSLNDDYVDDDDDDETYVKKKKKKISKKINVLKDRLMGKDPKITYKRFAIFYLLSAILTLIIYDPMLNLVLNWQLQLNPGNMFVWMWQELPAELHGDIYLYEIRNGKQFLNGAKANLIEQGPFTFEMSRKRRVVEWKPTTVRFKERYTAELLTDLSKSIETKMKVMNTTIFAIISWAVYWMDKFMIKFLNPIVHNVIVLALQTFNERIVEERTAKEILLGRQIDILRFFEIIGQPLRTIGIQYDLRELMTNYGNYKLNNNSISIIGILTGNEFGPFETARFINGNLKVNQVVKVLEKQTFDEFRPPCNRFRSLYDPLYFGHGEQSDVIDIWVQHFCRPLRFIYDGNTEWKRGIRSHRYDVSTSMFDIRIRDNQCYCHGTKKLIDCDGYTNVAGCFGGLPFALSFPHYYGAPKLQSSIYGLHADPQQHLSQVYMEPNLGILFEAKIKFQISLMLKDFPSFGQLGGIRDGLLPFFTISMNIRTTGLLHILVVIGSLLFLFGKFLLIISCLTLSTFFFYRSYKY